MVIANLTQQVTRPVIEQVTRFVIDNSTAIPLKIVTETSSGQFTINLILALISSIFVFYIIGAAIGVHINDFAVKIFMKVLKKRTKKHILLLKHTNTGLFDMDMINTNEIKHISHALSSFKGEPFDLIMHTPGGEVFAALMISRYFKSYPGEIRSIVPYYAMSGGTLLALSTDKILLGNQASLGPIDPQLGSWFKFGSAEAWKKVVKFKGNKANDDSVIFDMMGRQYTKSIKNHISESIKFSIPPRVKERFIERITSGTIEHAYPLTFDELQSYGLPVFKLNADKKITKLLYKIINLKSNSTVLWV